jgi:hypothetical protein
LKIAEQTGYIWPKVEALELLAAYHQTRATFPVFKSQDEKDAAERYAKEAESIKKGLFLTEEQMQKLKAQARKEFEKTDCRMERTVKQSDMGADIAQADYIIGSFSGGWRPISRSALRIAMTRSRLSSNAFTVALPIGVNPIIVSLSFAQEKCSCHLSILGLKRRTILLDFGSRPSIWPDFLPDDAVGKTQVIIQFFIKRKLVVFLFCQFQLFLFEQQLLNPSLNARGRFEDRNTFLQLNTNRLFQWQ